MARESMLGRSDQEWQEEDAPILIAEDSPTQAMQLRYLLEERGHVVVRAADGEEALELARKEHPKLVISDVMMPGMNGYEMCQALKNDPDLNDIPVVLVTNLSSPHDVFKGLNCGADNFITKPYDERYLIARVHYLLTNRALRSRGKLQVGVEIEIGGQRHFINAERQQVLDLLISTYEEAVRLQDGLLQRERSLQRSYDSLNALYTLAETLNEARTPAEVAERALGRCLALPGVRGGWLYLLEADGFRSFGGRALPREMRKLASLDGDCACKRNLISGKLAESEAVHACELLRSIDDGGAAPAGHLATPLRVNGDAFGVLNLVSDNEHGFTEEERRLIDAAAAQIGAALDRANLYRDMELKVEDRTRTLAKEVEERTRAEQEARLAEARLRDAIDSIPDSIALYDTGDRLVLSNQKLTGLHAEMRRYVEPGISFEDMVRFSFSSGTVPTDGEDDVEKLVVAAVETHRRATGRPYEVKFRDGRIFMVRDQRTSDGGIVTVRTDITELREVEGSARQAEARLRDAVQSMNDSFTLFDADDRLVLSNARWNHLSPNFAGEIKPGISFEEMMRAAAGNDVYAQRAGDPETWICQRLEHFRQADGEPFEVGTSDGHWYLVRAQRTSDGGTVVIRTNVTDLKRSEQRLDKQARAQAAIAAFGQFALSQTNLEAVTQRACEVVTEMLDAPFVKILELRNDGNLHLIAGVGWKDGYVGRATVPAGAESIGGYTVENEAPTVVPAWRHEIRFKKPKLLRDHKVRSSIAIPIMIDGGGVFGVLGADSMEENWFSEVDVTFHTAIAHTLGMAIERSRAASALTVSESRFRDFAQCSADWFWETDMTQRVTYLSGRRAPFEGIAPDMDDMIGKRRSEALESINPVPDPCPVIQDFMDRGEPFSDLEYSFVHPKNGRVWVSLSGVPVRGVDGKPDRFRGVGSDVTASKAAAAALQQSIQRFELAARAASAGLWDMDCGTDEVYYAPRFCAQLGHAEEVVNDDISFLRRHIHPDDVDHVMAALDAHLTTRLAFDLECRMDRDGEWRWFNLIGQATLDPDGQPQRMCGWIHDITDRRQAEEQLRQAQKMDAIGNLTGGVAHDFNNMLTIILGNLDLLADMVADDGEKRELVEAALHAGERGEDLTRQLLTFSRRQSLSPTRVLIGELVTGLVKLLGRTLGPGIEITLALEDDIWPVRIDPAQLESALANLAVNARDAMPNGGRLTIDASNVSVDAVYAGQRIEMDPGDYVRLDVSDSGSGIPADIRNRIFEPFFTTKEVGKGTGLGLAMVFGFIKQSGGHIAVYSEVGVGTTFQLYLPRTPEPAGSARVVDDGSDLPRAVDGETVLLVDDEGAVRKTAAAHMRALGYAVLEAEDGAGGIAQLLRRQRIDILFSDIAMPGGMYGTELARRAREMRPDLKVVLTSGFADPKLLRDCDTATRVLQKPFRRDVLARALREELDR